MVRTLRRRIVAVAAGAALALTPAVASAAPAIQAPPAIQSIAASAKAAPAKDIWVYVVVNHRVCGTAGTQVRNIQGNFQWSGGSSTINWENDGDNVVYPRVGQNKKVTYQINAQCYRKHLGVWIPVGFRALTGTFTPTSHQQTIRVG